MLRLYPPPSPTKWLSDIQDSKWFLEAPVIFFSQLFKRTCVKIKPSFLVVPLFSNVQLKKLYDYRTHLFKQQ